MTENKSVCIEKIDGVQIFLNPDGTYTGYDFKNGKFIADPYKDKPADYKPVRIRKSPEEVAEELNEISHYKVFDLPKRALKAENLERFGIKIGVSEIDGITPDVYYYPYTVNSKITAYKAGLVNLVNGKKVMYSIGDQTDVDLFGWDQAVATGAKKLFITEGEMDAVALFQIFKETSKGTPFEKFDPAVVSLPHGAGSAARDIARLKEKINAEFKEVVLVFDNDDAGKKAVEEVLKISSDFMSASLPEKDANACLIEGKSIACRNACMFKAVVPKNSRLINASSLHEQAKVAAEFGLSYPWKHVTEATRGIRTGETIYIGAGAKMGKSEVVNTLIAWCIKEHNWKCFAAKPEEANKKTYKLVAGKLVGSVFHDPKKPFDEEAYDRAGAMMKDKLFLLDLYQNIKWESLREDIRYAATQGCKAIFIDPITNLTNGMESGAANTKLQEIAQELSVMALDLDIVIFIFCHLRNPEAGLPHERGGKVLTSQFAGSRAMARSCNYMFGLEGNKDPENKIEERNIRTLVLLEDREYGEVGRFHLYWDEKTGMFNEF